ncbi:MAG: hypothetical protein ACE5EX_07720 [Phycisphaerae bacterium]
MARRHGTGCFLALWAFLALPALCTAGVLGHACDCGGSSECRHESDCSSDPCRKLAASRPGQDNDMAKSMPLFVGFPSLAACVSQMDSLGVRESVPEGAPPTNLPCPPTDLPLLI